ncbi:MAG: hypothetical protein V1678_01390 [Candidatus Aenigmatarchaeota archaeon]
MGIKIKLPTPNQMLTERYSEYAVDGLRRQNKVVDEDENSILIENCYAIDGILVREHINIDRRSGKPTDAKKDFEYMSNVAKPKLLDSIGKMSDRTRGVIYPSEAGGIISINASVSPNGEIDGSVVKHFREAEAIAYLANELSKNYLKHNC